LLAHFLKRAIGMPLSFAQRSRAQLATAQARVAQTPSEGLHKLTNLG
jgi:hypothetical protein